MLLPSKAPETKVPESGLLALKSLGLLLALLGLELGLLLAQKSGLVLLLAVLPLPAV